MKKRFWAVPLAAFAVACLVFLSGCGGPSVEELIREDISTGLDAINAENEELLTAMEDGADGVFETMGVSSKEFAEAYFGDFTYTIGDITVDQDAGVAEAKVTVNVRSMSDVVTRFGENAEEFLETVDPSQYQDEEDFMAVGGQLMMDAVTETKPKESEITLTYTKDDEGAWSIQGNSLDQLLATMY